MSAQLSLLEPTGSSYVQACLERGAQIVSKGTKCEGAVVLCPSCYSEAGLDPEFDGEDLISFKCDCGNEFKNEDAALLTFKVAGKKR